jgi:hypothetical protein
MGWAPHTVGFTPYKEVLYICYTLGVQESLPVVVGGNSRSVIKSQKYSQSEQNEASSRDTGNFSLVQSAEEHRRCLVPVGQSGDRVVSDTWKVEEL